MTLPPSIRVKFRNGEIAQFDPTGHEDGSYMMTTWVKGFVGGARFRGTRPKNHVEAFLFEACQELGTVVEVKGNWS